MILRRIVPNLNVDNATTGHDFYEEFLGLEKQFDMGWVASFRSPSNPSIQVTLVGTDETAPEQSSMSVAVADGRFATWDAPHCQSATNTARPTRPHPSVAAASRNRGPMRAPRDGVSVGGASGRSGAARGARSESTSIASCAMS